MAVCRENSPTFDLLSSGRVRGEHKKPATMGPTNTPKIEGSNRTWLHRIINREWTTDRISYLFMIIIQCIGIIVIIVFTSPINFLLIYGLILDSSMTLVKDH